MTLATVFALSTLLLPFALMAYAAWKMITRGTRLTPPTARNAAQRLMARLYGVDQ